MIPKLRVARPTDNYGPAAFLPATAWGPNSFANTTVFRWRNAGAKSQVFTTRSSRASAGHARAGAPSADHFAGALLTEQFPPGKPVV